MLKKKKCSVAACCPQCTAWVRPSAPDFEAAFHAAMHEFGYVGLFRVVRVSSQVTKLGVADTKTREQPSMHDFGYDIFDSDM